MNGKREKRRGENELKNGRCDRIPKRYENNNKENIKNNDCVYFENSHISNNNYNSS